LPPTSSNDGSQKPPRKRLAGNVDTRPDFINATPLLETTLPFNQHTPTSTQLFDRLPKGLVYPKFPSEDGTLMTTICFCAAFSSPHNCCKTRLCKERRPPRQTRLHVDLSIEPWKSKPESFWTPLVTFLQDPLVTPHLRPSSALRNVTPSAAWH
jgi:hypothetical protein